jgi:hypothetical protein
VLELGTRALLGAHEGERRAHGFSFQMQQKQEQAGSDISERRKQLIEQIEAALSRGRSRVGVGHEREAVGR